MLQSIYKIQQACETVIHTDYKMLIFALRMFEALAAIFLPAQNPSFMHPCIRFYRSSNPSASFTANHQSCKKLVVKQTPQSWIENIWVSQTAANYPMMLV